MGKMANAFGDGGKAIGSKQVDGNSEDNSKISRGMSRT